MRFRKNLFKIIIAAFLIYIIASNVFVIKPFKDFKSENFKNISIGEISKSNIDTLEDKEIIEGTIKALKKINITKTVPEPVITNTVNYINLTDFNGEVINIMEAKPYIFLSGTWYQGDFNSFNSLYNIYEKYIYK